MKVVGEIEIYAISIFDKTIWVFTNDFFKLISWKTFVDHFFNIWYHFGSFVHYPNIIIRNNYKKNIINIKNPKEKRMFSSIREKSKTIIDYAVQTYLSVKEYWYFDPDLSTKSVVSKRKLKNVCSKHGHIRKSVKNVLSENKFLYKIL